MSGGDVGDVDVELLVPPAHLVDRAVLLDQQRIVDAGLVLPDLDVLQEALADALGERRGQLLGRRLVAGPWASRR